MPRTSTSGEPIPQTINPPQVSTDSRGKTDYDPTANVIALNEASVRRQDDLRNAEATRQNELRLAESKRVDEMMKIRAEHYKELNEKETARLDSIRQVDVQNQALAAKSALDAIQALAATTTVNADNIRNALTNTATQMAKQTTDLASSIAASTAATVDAMTVRIAALEKAQAEGVGKGRVSDPQLESLMNEVKMMRDQQTTSTGSGAGMRNLWGIIVGAIGLFIAVTAYLAR